MAHGRRRPVLRRQDERHVGDLRERLLQRTLAALPHVLRLLPHVRRAPLDPVAAEPAAVVDDARLGEQILGAVRHRRPGEADADLHVIRMLQRRAPLRRRGPLELRQLVDHETVEGFAVLLKEVDEVLMIDDDDVALGRITLGGRTRRDGDPQVPQVFPLRALLLPHQLGHAQRCRHQHATHGAVGEHLAQRRERDQSLPGTRTSKNHALVAFVDVCDCLLLYRPDCYGHMLSKSNTLSMTCTSKPNARSRECQAACSGVGFLPGALNSMNTTRPPADNMRRSGTPGYP